MRHLRFGIAYAVVVKAAGAVFSHHRFGFGSAECTGRRCCLSLQPFARDEIRNVPWRNSKAFSVYGVPPSTIGNIIFESSFPRASVTGVWPDT